MSPSNSSSSSPETDQRLNDIVVAVQEKSTLTNPKQVSPQEVVPEMNNPKQVSPQEVMPEVTNPKQVSPQEVVPEVNNPKQMSPQEVMPEVNNPKQVSPQEIVHEVNNPKHGSTQEIVPEVNKVSPQEAVPEVNDPKQVSPQDVVLEVNNPKQVSPQEVVPEVSKVSPQEVVPDLNNPKQGFPQEVVPERKKTERPSFELRVLRTLDKLIKKYPSKDNHALICNICKRGFPNANSLCAHQKTHKHDPEMERKLKQVEASYSPGQCFWKKPDNSYQGTSNSVDFGGSAQVALSNGISRGRVRNVGINEVMGYPSAPPYGKTGYGFSPGAPFTHNYNRPNLSDLNRRGLSFGPCKPNGGGTNSNYPWLFNGGFAMAPPATPNRPFIVNPRNGSLPFYSYGPHASTILNSIALPNTLGSCNINNHSSSQGALSLELSLGPSKWMGGINNNSSVYPSLNGGVSGGGSMDLNMPVPSLVSRNHFYGNYPLVSITRDVPPPPPSPVTSLPNDEYVPGCSSLEEKNKVVVVDDDEKDNGVIGDHDADQPAEV